MISLTRSAAIAGFRPRQQRRSSATRVEEENAARRGLPGDEAAPFFRKAIRACQRGEKAEAVRRSRKLARKQAVRDGLIAPPKKRLDVGKASSMALHRGGRPRLEATRG